MVVNLKKLKEKVMEFFMTSNWKLKMQKHLYKFL